MRTNKQREEKETNVPGSDNELPKTPRRKKRSIQKSKINYHEENDSSEGEQVMIKKRKTQNEILVAVGEDGATTSNRSPPTKEKKSRSKKRIVSSESESVSENNGEAEESDYSTETDDEVSEDEKMIVSQLGVQENEFKEQHDAVIESFSTWGKTELEKLSENSPSCSELLVIAKQHLPKIVAFIENFISNTNKLRSKALNMRYSTTTHVKIFYNLFLFCVNKNKEEYEYDNFFTCDQFNHLIKDYIDYLSFTRKLTHFPRIRVTSNGESVISNELALGTIQSHVSQLYCMIKVFELKISNEVRTLIGQIRTSCLKEQDIMKTRNLKETELLKWPFTPYDHNWLLQKFPIFNVDDLCCNAFIALMNYLGIRQSTAKSLVLNDVMIYHRGRTISHIMLNLTHLKEQAAAKSVSIPGNLSPIDVIGLIILYLNTRKVFECGLPEETPDFKIKKEFKDKPFFELPFNIKTLYRQISKKLGAPSFAVSSRSSRKGHCVMHALRTKTQYPAMPIEMLEEDLISHGTWTAKIAMRCYLNGGCNQIKRTFDILENMQPPPVTLDAKEHFVFLVDALETVRDWQIDESDPSVTTFEKNFLANGGKKN